MNMRVAAPFFVVGLCVVGGLYGCSSDEEGASSSGGPTSSSSSSGESGSGSSSGGGSSSGSSSGGSSSGSTSGGSSSGGSSSGSSSGGSGCTELTLSDWRLLENGELEGGYTSYQATPAPLSDGVHVLYLTMNGDDRTQVVDLAEDDNDQLRICQHCVFLADADDQATFMASRGTMDVRAVSFETGAVDLTLTDVTLVEVTVDDSGTSTPVDGGRCMRLATAELSIDE